MHFFDYITDPCYFKIDLNAINICKPLITNIDYVKTLYMIHGLVWTYFQLFSKQYDVCQNTIIRLSAVLYFEYVDEFEIT